MYSKIVELVFFPQVEKQQGLFTTEHFFECGQRQKPGPRGARRPPGPPHFFMHLRKRTTARNLRKRRTEIEEQDQEFLEAMEADIERAIELSKEEARIKELITYVKSLQNHTSVFYKFCILLPNNKRYIIELSKEVTWNDLFDCIDVQLYYLNGKQLPKKDSYALKTNISPYKTFNRSPELISDVDPHTLFLIKYY